MLCRVAHTPKNRGLLKSSKKVIVYFVFHICNQVNIWGDVSLRTVRSSSLIIVVIAALFVCLLGSPVEAMTLTAAPNYAIDCTGITQTAAAQAQWNRDTSGTGRENLQYTVTDGLGNVIFTYNDVRAVGSTATLIGFSFTTAPLANPISFKLSSPPGNGFPEQVFVTMVGTCAGLSTKPPKTVTTAPVTITILWDDRVNHDQVRDVGAPVAIYQHDDVIQIYAVNLDDSHGKLVFTLSKEEWGNAPKENKLLITGQNPFSGVSIELWRLSTGEFQINTNYADGKIYVRTWTFGEDQGSYDPLPLN